jgi:splicing factor 3A subunit 3
MDSIIELQRQSHEEIERYEQALYTILSRPQNVHQNRLQNEHKASQILDRISSRVTTLNSIYKDEDVRRTEINAISTPSQPGDLSEFYARLGKVQEHHNKYPDTGADAIEFEIATLLDEFNPEDYDDEEAVYEDREFARLFSSLSTLISVVCSCGKHVFWRRGVRKIPRLICESHHIQQHEEYRKACRLSSIP